MTISNPARYLHTYLMHALCSNQILDRRSWLYVYPAMAAQSRPALLLRKPLPDPKRMASLCKTVVAAQMADPEYEKQRIVIFHKQSEVWWSPRPVDLEKNFAVMYILAHEVTDRVPPQGWLGCVLLHLTDMLPGRNLS